MFPYPTTKYGKYQDHALEQYKICVEMADRVSSRRNLANTFFLTLHTLLFGTLGFLYEKGPVINRKWTVLLILVALLSLCYVGEVCRGLIQTVKRCTRSLCPSSSLC